VESDKASDAVSDPVDLHTHWFPKECKMYLALCIAKTKRPPRRTTAFAAAFSL
jgi:hypothetical protein